jgi:endonuclease YncB( thermonuclease family)
MNRLTPWLVLAFILFAAHPCFPWSGKCVGIADGDTIRVMHLGKAEKIRLFGIDRPRLVSVVKLEEECLESS